MIVTLAIILAEISLVLLVVLVVIAGKALARRRRDQAAASTLLNSIKTNEPKRVEKLVGVLKDSSQLNDEDALNKANELIKKQNKFYQDAIDLYFTRNHEVLSKLDGRLEELLSQYQGMITVSGGEKPTVDSEAVVQLSKDIAALGKEIEELRAENGHLTEQLKAAENELDQLGQEYVSAFNKPKVIKAKSMDGDEQSEAGAEQEAPMQSDAEPSDISENVQEIEPKSKPEPEPEPEAATVEASSQATEKPPADDEKTEDKPAEGDVQLSGEDTEDEGVLNDLELADLIGDQPGQQTAKEKPADKR